MILLLVILVMLKRIGLVVALFHEAGDCISSMPCLLFQPVATFLALIFFFMYWCIILAFLSTSGKLIYHIALLKTLPLLLSTGWFQEQIIQGMFVKFVDKSYNVIKSTTISIKCISFKTYTPIQSKLPKNVSIFKRFWQKFMFKDT